MNASSTWSVWQATFTVWTSGYKYEVDSRVQDAAGNYSTVNSTSIFRYDTTPPQSYVFLPQNGQYISSLTNISGTSLDLPITVGQSGPSGLTIMQIAIMNLQTGKWWSSTAFDQGTISPLTPTGLSNWTYNGLGSNSLQSGTSYFITSRAWDAAGNIENWYSVRGATFTFDNIGPVSQILNPQNNGAYTSLSTISGTSWDATSGVNSVNISLQDLSGGTSKYWTDNGLGSVGWQTNINQYWITISSVAPGGVTVNWQYFQPLLNSNLNDGHYYQVMAQGFDNINNPQAIISSSTFIYDITKPTACVTEAIMPVSGQVVTPMANQYIQNIQYIGGTAADNGCAVNNSGLQASGVQYVIILESTSYETGSPVPLYDYVWNGSTWTVLPSADISPYWLTATGGTNWDSQDMTNKWYSGRWYIVKARATDKAGNVQDDTLEPWTSFSVSLPAQSFLVSLVNTQNPNAGDPVSVQVEAVDQNGDPARNYQGDIRFSVDGPITSPGGPEYVYTAGDTQGWLPNDYQFTTLDQGVKIFNINYSSRTLKLVKDGSRTIFVTDINNNSVSGQKVVSVNTTAPTELRVLSPGVSRAPGVVGGITGGPQTRTAGISFNATVDACDNYWNVVPSTSTTVKLTTTDQYATPAQISKNLTDSSGLPQGTTVYAVTLVTRGNWSLTAQDMAGPLTQSTLANVPVQSAAANRLLMLVPGEAGVYGKPPYTSQVGGKNTTVTAQQVAGVPFTVTVSACDYYWNKVDTYAGNIAAVTSDNFSIVPSTQVLTNGTTTFNITLVTSATSYVSASVYQGTALSSATSDGIYVGPTTAAKLQLLVPGETACPGKANQPETNLFGTSQTWGKLNTPSQMTVGTSYYVTVNLVDRFYNVVSTVTMPVAKITTSDPNETSGNNYFSYLPPEAQLVGGTKTFPVTMVTAGNRTVNVIDDGGTGYLGDTSPGITLNPSTITQLRLLVDGEHAAPGTFTGKDSGTPNQQTAGVAFASVEIDACDNYWNTNTIGSRQIALLTTDPYAASWGFIPGPVGLINGTKNFANTVKLTTLGSWNLTAIDNEGPVVWSSQTVAGINVVQNTPTQLQLVLPGETIEGGSVNGKLVTPSPQQAGSPFTVTVCLTDAYWNKVLLSAPTVQLTLTDQYGRVNNQQVSTPVQEQLIAGQNTLNVTLYNATTQYITVNDVDGSNYTSTQTVTFPVSPRNPSKLLVLNPGETYVPAKYNVAPYGKSGTVTNQTAGVPFVVTVYSCDAYWNISSTNVYCWLGTQDSNDPYATFSPSTATLVNVSTFTVTLMRAQGTFIMTNHNTDSSLADYIFNTNSNAPITVQTGTASKFQVLVPNETAVPGSSTGKSGASLFSRPRAMIL